MSNITSGISVKDSLRFKDDEKVAIPQESPTDSNMNRILTAGAHPMVMFIDPYKKSIEHASGGRNTVIYDDQGNPNIMVVIPRMNYEDLDLPDLNLGTGTMTAFETNGVARSEILISKYINSQVSGTGFASIGGATPKNYVTFDTAKTLCTNKGVGWHMVSQHEWEMLRLIGLKFNPDIRGNTYYGRSHENTFENGSRPDGRAAGDTSGTAYTKTGSGPLAWSHDGTPYGVMDLVGNIWEWVDQFKIIDGQVICTPDNQPDLDESLWTYKDQFYDCASSSVQLSDKVTVTGLRNTLNNADIVRTAGYTTSELLRRLGIEQDTTTSDGRLGVNNEGERLPIRGGYWSNSSDAGPAALYLGGLRSNSSSFFGSRSAFFA